jgi:hypothetical protein
MNRFEDAVAELVATTPEPRSIEQLRRRVRRRRRWHAVTVIAVIAVIAGVTVGAAASLRSTSDQPSISVAPRTSAAKNQSQWCGVSRDVLVRIARLTASVAPGDRLEAKLMTWGELHRAMQPSSSGGGLDDKTVIWAVEALGTVKPEFADRSYAWGVFRVDAHTDRVYGLAAGPGTSPSYWADLPDHATACPQSTAATPPTTAFRGPSPSTTMPIGGECAVSIDWTSPRYSNGYARFVLRVRSSRSGSVLSVEIREADNGHSYTWSGETNPTGGFRLTDAVTPNIVGRSAVVVNIDGHPAIRCSVATTLPPLAR